jgi:3-mercaptopyruvate sulfurtransferase SseA
MSKPVSALRWVTPGQLAQLLDGANVRVLDVRALVWGRGGGGQALHVPGAIHVSAEELLSSADCLLLLAARMAELGVGDEHPVVVYDEDGLGRAVEVAELLVRRGHQHAWALAGGFRSWCASGLAAVQRWSTYPPASFTVRIAS